MSEISRNLVRGQKELERAQGKLTFTWGGNEYVCTAGQTSAEQMLTVGGEQMHASLTLIVRSSLLPDPGPKEKQVLTFDSRVYRIAKVNTVHGGNLVSLVLEDRAQGA